MKKLRATLFLDKYPNLNLSCHDNNKYLCGYCCTYYLKMIETWRRTDTDRHDTIGTWYHLPRVRRVWLFAGPELSLPTEIRNQNTSIHLLDNDCITCLGVGQWLTRVVQLLVITSIPCRCIYIICPRKFEASFITSCNQILPCPINKELVLASTHDSASSGSKYSGFSYPTRASASQSTWSII